MNQNAQVYLTIWKFDFNEYEPLLLNITKYDQSIYLDTSHARSESLQFAYERSKKCGRCVEGKPSQMNGVILTFSEVIIIIDLYRHCIFWIYTKTIWIPKEQNIWLMHWKWTKYDACSSQSHFRWSSLSIFIDTSDSEYKEKPTRSRSRKIFCWCVNN